MTEKELREKIGIGEKDLIDSPQGLVDILRVKDDVVVLGYLAGGVKQVDINDFLENFNIIEDNGDIIYF